MNIEDYISERVDGQIKWHSEKSKKYQACYKKLQIAQMILSSSTPLLSGFFMQWKCTPFLVALVGLIITIISGFLTLNRYHEKWIEYRATCELLKREKYLYLMQVPPYGCNKNSEEVFVSNIESILYAENNNWKEIVSVPAITTHSSTGS